MSNELHILEENSFCSGVVGGFDQGVEEFFVRAPQPRENLRAPDPHTGSDRIPTHRVRRHGKRAVASVFDEA